MSETVKMGQQTLKLNQRTESMTGDNKQEEGLEISQVYINVGTILKDKYCLKGGISDSTGEADIFLAEYEGEKYVAKVYRTRFRPNSKTVEDIKEINSPLIAKILDEGMAGDRYFEILPYYKKGDLQRLSPLSEEFVIDVVIPGVNEALKLMHSRGLVHMDIKPGNIFLSDDEKHIVLGDFGTTLVLYKDQSVRHTRNIAGTYSYASIEALSGIITKEADYSSFGETLIYLLTGVDPYEGIQLGDLKNYKVAHKVSIPESISPRLRKLIRGLTIKEREDRWGYEEMQRDQNLGLFMLILLLNPNALLTCGEMSFYNLREYGEAILRELPHVNPNLLDALKSGRIIHFARTRGYGKEVIDGLEELHREAKSDEETAYYKLGFKLCKDSCFKYREREFSSLDNLIAYIYENSEDVLNIANELVENKYFLSWLEHLGFGSHIDEWRRLYSDNNGGEECEWA